MLLLNITTAEVLANPLLYAQPKTEAEAAAKAALEMQLHTAGQSEVEQSTTAVVCGGMRVRTVEAYKDIAAGTIGTFLMEALTNPRAVVRFDIGSGGANSAPFWWPVPVHWANLRAVDSEACAAGGCNWGWLSTPRARRGRSTGLDALPRNRRPRAVSASAPVVWLVAMRDALPWQTHRRPARSPHSGLAPRLAPPQVERRGALLQHTRRRARLLTQSANARVRITGNWVHHPTLEKEMEFEDGEAPGGRAGNATQRPRPNLHPGESDFIHYPPGHEGTVRGVAGHAAAATDAELQHGAAEVLLDPWRDFNGNAVAETLVRVPWLELELLAGIGTVHALAAAGAIPCGITEYPSVAAGVAAQRRDAGSHPYVVRFPGAALVPPAAGAAWATPAKLRAHLLHKYGSLPDHYSRLPLELRLRQLEGGLRHLEGGHHGRHSRFFLVGCILDAEDRRAWGLLRGGV